MWLQQCFCPWGDEGHRCAKLSDKTREARKRLDGWLWGPLFSELKTCQDLTKVTLASQLSWKTALWKCLLFYYLGTQKYFRNCCLVVKTFVFVAHSNVGIVGQNIWNLNCPEGYRVKATLGTGFPSGTVVKNPPANAGDARDSASVPGLGRSPGIGNGKPLQYSCLEKSMDRGDCWAIVHGVTKSQTQLRDWAPLEEEGRKGLGKGER